MSAHRKRLPSRRCSVSCSFEFEGHRYSATASWFADGRLAELFLDVPGKFGTPMQANADNAAILASLLLQHGVKPEVIRHSVTGAIAMARAEFGGGQ
jgi:ribonucleoside-diphosphate reductase alpha chain